mgnify:CR=1 FL=1
MDKIIFVKIYYNIINYNENIKTLHWCCSVLDESSFNMSDSLIINAYQSCQWETGPIRKLASSNSTIVCVVSLGYVNYATNPKYIKLESCH